MRHGRARRGNPARKRAAPWREPPFARHPSGGGLLGFPYWGAVVVAGGVVVGAVEAGGLASGVVAACSAAVAGGVLAARLPPPLAPPAPEVVAIEVAGAPPPGVRVLSDGRVAYQPAAASAARATRPTPTAAGATERSRRTVV